MISPERYPVLSWFPEPEPPTGGIGATGILKLLGAPDLKRIEVLLRETIQNSWDAAVSRSGVTYSMRAARIDAGRLASLKNDVFGRTIEKARSSPELNQFLPLLDVLHEPDFPGLFITDSGTRGLGGPVLPGEEAKAGEKTDFRDFVFKVGAPPTEAHTGGSYGFGKSIGYLVSRARCVVIYSKTRTSGGDIESRLIGAAVGKEYHLNGVSYTGRHWWGVPEGSEAISPLTGSEADDLATSLGFRTEDVSPTGTSILILAPDFDEDLDAVMQDAAWSITENFWPKMIPHDGEEEPPMKFEVTSEDRVFEVPHPDATDPLPLHAAALRAVRSALSGRLKDDFKFVINRETGETIQVHLKAIKTKRPNADVGMLGIAIAPVKSGEHRVGAESQPFEIPARGIALVRSPELIVRYETGAAHHADGMEWGGVFKTVEQLDGIFRDAEPPTHDDWHAPALGDRTHQTYVRVGLRRLGEVVEALMQAEGPSQRSDPAWNIANELGDLLPGVPAGTRKKPGGSGSGSSGGHRRPKVRILSSGPAQDGTETVSRAVFSVDSPTGAPVTVEVLAAVAAHEDGRREDPARILAFGPESDPVAIDGTPSSLNAKVDPGAKYIVDADFDDRLARVIEIRVTSDGTAGE